MMRDDVYQQVPFSTLTGKTLKSVTAEIDGEVAIFETTDGERYEMYHDRECCEEVTIDDIVGNLDDLIGFPIIFAREVSKHSYEDGCFDGKGDDSFTWTFYHIATIKGYVTFRWYGGSNGYYSEDVYFAKVNI